MSWSPQRPPQSPQRASALPTLLRFCFISVRQPGSLGDPVTFPFCAATRVAPFHTGSPFASALSAGAAFTGAGAVAAAPKSPSSSSAATPPSSPPPTTRLRLLGASATYCAESRDALLEDFPRLPYFLFPEAHDVDCGSAGEEGAAASAFDRDELFSAAADAARTEWQGATPFTIISEGSDAHEMLGVTVRISRNVSVGAISDFPYFLFISGFLELAARQLRRWLGHQERRRRGAGSGKDALTLASTAVSDPFLNLEALSDIMQPLLELTVGNGSVNALSVARGSALQLSEWSGVFEALGNERAKPTAGLSERPNEHRFHGIDVPLSHLLYAFGYDEIRLLQSIVAQGERLLFAADTYAQAAGCVLAAGWCLLSPLRWGGALIPVLPRAFLECLVGDAPFIAGTATLTLPELLVLPLGSTWIADCRTGRVALSSTSSSGPTSSLSASSAAALELLPYSDKLKTNLKRHVPKLTRQQWLEVGMDAAVASPATAAVEALLPPRFSPTSQDELLLLFTDYMATHVLGRYRQYLQPDGNVGGLRLDPVRCVAAVLTPGLARRISNTPALRDWVDETLAVETAGAMTAVRGTPKEAFYERCAYRFPEMYPEFVQGGGPSSTKKFISMVSKAKESLKSAVVSQATHAPAAAFHSGNSASVVSGLGAALGALKGSAGSTAAMLVKGVAGKSGAGSSGSFRRSGTFAAPEAEPEQLEVQRITIDVLDRFDAYHELLDPRRVFASSGGGAGGSKAGDIRWLVGGGGVSAAQQNAPSGPTSSAASRRPSAEPSATSAPAPHHQQRPSLGGIFDEYSATQSTAQHAGVAVFAAAQRSQQQSPVRPSSGSTPQVTPPPATSAAASIPSDVEAARRAILSLDFIPIGPQVSSTTPATSRSVSPQTSPQRSNGVGHQLPTGSQSQVAAIQPAATAVVCQAPSNQALYAQPQWNPAAVQQPTLHGQSQPVQKQQWSIDDFFK